MANGASIPLRRFPGSSGRGDGQTLSLVAIRLVFLNFPAARKRRGRGGLRRAAHPTRVVLNQGAWGGRQIAPAEVPVARHYALCGCPGPRLKRQFAG